MDSISLYFTQRLAAHNRYSNVCWFHFKLKDTFSHMSTDLVTFILAFFSELVGEFRKLTDLLRRNVLISEHIGETVLISDFKLLAWVKIYKMMNPVFFFFFYWNILSSQLRNINDHIKIWSETHPLRHSLGQFGISINILNFISFDWAILLLGIHPLVQWI